MASTGKIIIFSLCWFSFASSKPLLKKDKCRFSKDCASHQICQFHRCENKLQTPIMKERFCLMPHDCPVMYTCNQTTFHCQPITTIAEIMSKQRCRSVFKKFCQKDSHCACAEAKMVCEDNECVRFDENRKNKSERCHRDTDCPPLHRCEKHKCVESRISINDLPTFPTLCYSNRDCPRSKKCIVGACMKSGYSNQLVNNFKAPSFPSCNLDNDCSQSNTLSRCILNKCVPVLRAWSKKKSHMR